MCQGDFWELVAYLGRATETFGFFKKSIVNLSFEVQCSTKAGIFNGFLCDNIPLPALSRSRHKQGCIMKLIILGYWLIQNFLDNEFIYPELALHGLQSQKWKNFLTYLFSRVEERTSGNRWLTVAPFSLVGLRTSLHHIPFQVMPFTLCWMKRQRFELKGSEVQCWAGAYVLFRWKTFFSFILPPLVSWAVWTIMKACSLFDEYLK